MRLIVLLVLAAALAGCRRPAAPAPVPPRCRLVHADTLPPADSTAVRQIREVYHCRPLAGAETPR